MTVAKMNGIPIIYHYYICDDKHVKLTISCSDMWEAQKQQEDKNIIGYVNKGLHWHDMMFFKEKGIVSYDWGGVTWNEENPSSLDGINKFKMSFGGEKVSYYSETVIVSLKAKILLKIKKLLKR